MLASQIATVPQFSPNYPIEIWVRLDGFARGCAKTIRIDQRRRYINLLGVARGFGSKLLLDEFQ
jgi:hypothetical protein